MLISLNVLADDKPSLFDLSGELPEINPDVERRDIVLPKIDTEDFELGVYAGVLSVEDFGANLMWGMKAIFHITEDFFLNGNVSYSEIDDENLRRLNLPIFGESKTRKVRDQSLLLGWNVLPGEAFFTDSYVFTSSLYILFGVGTINFDSEDYFTLTGGVGFKILPTDWLALSVESRISEYESSILGYKKHSHNTELSMGVSVFF